MQVVHFGRFGEPAGSSNAPSIQAAKKKHSMAPGLKINTPKGVRYYVKIPNSKIIFRELTREGFDSWRTMVANDWVGKSWVWNEGRKQPEGR